MAAQRSSAAYRSEVAERRGAGDAALSENSGPDVNTESAVRTASTANLVPGTTLSAVNELEGGSKDDKFQQVNESEDDKRRRSSVFLADRFPAWLSAAGYLGLALLGTVIIPLLYPKVQWYQVTASYLLAFLMALPNTYGDGLTDWDMVRKQRNVCDERSAEVKKKSV